VDDADERAAAQRLGALLTRLRKSHNLTQRELGRRSKISWTFIQLLELGVRKETGKAVTPSPQSLQKIAQGLSLSGDDLERKNPGVAAGIYRQMMEARGWSADEATPSPDISAPPTPEELREGLAALAGSDAGAEFATLAEHWYEMQLPSRRFILDAIKYVKAQEGIS
jgi:transcriptional regulator with XRE-family HTH domain